MDFYDRYSDVLENDDTYTSDIERESWKNYRNHVRNRGKADNNMMDYAALRKQIDKDVIQVLDKTIEDFFR
jgi:CRISPR/Cas system CMR-associated protein Cmr5 small subunit